MYTRKQPSFCFINVAFDLDVFLKVSLAFSRFKDPHVPDYIVFNRKCINFELRIDLSVANITFIVWLATALGMENCFIQYHNKVGLSGLNKTLRCRKDI